MNKISVIIPVYKIEKYIDKCLESVVNQTYKNFEVVLVDDGSPDSSGKKCDDWAKKDKRIKVFHKQNGGVSSARNFGIKKATGDFVTFVDGDDFIDAIMFEKMIEKQQESNFDMVFCGIKYVFDDKEFIAEEFGFKDFCKTKDIGKIIATEQPIVKGDKIIYQKSILNCIWRVLYRKSLIENFKFFEDVRYGEDCLFLMNILSKNKDVTLARVDLALYNYVQRGDSAVHDNSSWIFDDSKNFVKHLMALDIDENIKKAKKFLKYSDLFVIFLKMNNLGKLKEIKDWATKDNYQCSKKFYWGLRLKVKYFCIYHNFRKTLKFIYRFK